MLNMLIAMMGNTYAAVNEKSEKEFLKQACYRYKYFEARKLKNDVTCI